MTCSKRRRLIRLSSSSLDPSRNCASYIIFFSRSKLMCAALASLDGPLQVLLYAPGVFLDSEAPLYRRPCSLAELTALDWIGPYRLDCRPPLPFPPRYIVQPLI